MLCHIILRQVGQLSSDGSTYYVHLVPIAKKWPIYRKKSHNRMVDETWSDGCRRMEWKRLRIDRKIAHLTISHLVPWYRGEHGGASWSEECASTRSASWPCWWVSMSNQLVAERITIGHSAGPKWTPVTAMDVEKWPAIDDWWREYYS